jgi:hypothetical protein
VSQQQARRWEEQARAMSWFCHDMAEQEQNRRRTFDSIVLSEFDIQFFVAAN